MNRKILFALSLVACILFCSPFISATLAEDLAAINNEVWRYIASSPSDKIVVLGADRSHEESEALSLLQNSYPEIATYQVIEEKDVTKEIEENNLILILGGPAHSPYADSLFVASRDLVTSQRNLANGELRYIWHGARLTHIIFSDKDGFNREKSDDETEADAVESTEETNQDMQAVEKRAAPPRMHPAHHSPLNNFLPVQLIPLVVSGIGVGLIWFWKSFSDLFERILKSYTANKIMKKVKKKLLKHEFSGITFKGIRIKYREWIAIGLAALIFALAASYTYIFSGGFGYLLFATVANIIIYAVRNGARLFLDKMYDIHTEYTLWIWGAFVTILTGWLGSTFALAGYTIEDKNKKKSDKIPIISFAVNASTFAFFLIMLIFSATTQSYLVNIVCTLTISLVFLQMLPINPFSGKDIYGWNKKAWLGLFIPALISYVLIVATV